MLDTPITHTLTGGLILNTALVVTVMYLWSLTLKRTDQPHLHTLRTVLEILIATLSPLVLMQFPVKVQDGVLIDLRNVPLILITLRYGVTTGMLATLPTLLYRMHLGGVGVWPTYITLLTLLLLAGTMRNWVRRTPRNNTLKLASYFITSLSPLPGLLLLPNPPHYLLHVFPGYYLACVTALFASAHILHNRKQLLMHLARMQQDAHTDPLTLLSNRRKLQQDTPQFSESSYLLVFDVDHFKGINDHFGHAVGDRVLHVLGQALRREEPFSYRLGGEEFLVVFSGDSAATALQRAEELRHTLALHVRKGVPQIHKDVTVSAGLVLYRNTMTLDENLKQADGLLYQAKMRGRNQTLSQLDDVMVLHDALPAQHTRWTSQALEHTGMVVLLRDSHGRTLHLEGATQALLGVSELHEVWTSQHLKALQDLELQTLHTGVAQHQLIDVIGGHGQLHTLNMHCDPVLLPDESRGVLTVLTDVTLHLEAHHLLSTFSGLLQAHTPREAHLRVQEARLALREHRNRWQQASPPRPGQQGMLKELQRALTELVEGQRP